MRHITFFPGNFYMKVQDDFASTKRAAETR